MKTRTIGQCKECKYYISGAFADRCDNRYVGSKYDYYYPRPTFGCWYWKEKKK